MDKGDEIIITKHEDADLIGSTGVLFARESNVPTVKIGDKIFDTDWSCIEPTGNKQATAIYSIEVKSPTGLNARRWGRDAFAYYSLDSAIAHVARLKEHNKEHFPDCEYRIIEQLTTYNIIEALL